MARRKTIRDFPKSKRPREKLLSFGVANLDNFELLAVILGSGTKKENVVNLARKILRKINLKRLSRARISDLTNIEGLGTIQAVKILAALELGRRAQTDTQAKKILTPKDVLREIDDIRTKNREYLVALFLNARHELLERQTIAIGGLNTNSIESRDVFSKALALPCAFVVLVHNHPSNDPTPSKDDKTFTKRLSEAGELLGIKIVDHIIVSKKDYFSFREAKLL